MCRYISTRGVIMNLLATFLTVSIIIGQIPCRDNYTIRIPNTVDIDETGTIEIQMIDNDLNEYQTLTISAPDNITINDSNGKDPLNMNILNNTITFIQNESGSKSIHYSIDNISAGDWSGNLNLNISLSTNCPSNVLMNSSDIRQAIINSGCRSITFCDTYEGNNPIDISLAQDESILMYTPDRTNIIVTNNSNNKIIANEDMSGLFLSTTRLKTINNIDKIDFSNCKNISRMFESSMLTTINGLNNIDVSNVTDMSNLFKNNEQIVTIDLSNWNTAKVKNISQMFYGCSSLTSLSISNFNTSNCEDMSYLFCNDRALTSVGDISNWNTANVTNMSHMFEYTYKLSALPDISKWDVSNVEDFSYFLSNNKTLDYSVIENLNISNKCKNISHFFDSKTFAKASDYANLDLTNWDVSGVEDISYLFYFINHLDDINITGWNTANVTNMSHMFDVGQDTLSKYLDNIYGIESLNVSSVTNMEYIFNSVYYLNKDLSNWDTRNLTNLNYAFYACSNMDLTALENWDVSSLIDKNETFSGGSGSLNNSTLPSWY